ncbi:MAG: shikimate dehydrogenase family protein [Pseudolabrys sp.]
MLPPIVDGSTQFIAILGDPIAQVRSPAMWSALFRHNGVNAICIPVHARAAELGVAIAGLRAAQNCIGLIFTIPHKPAAASHVDELTERARNVDAINIARRQPDGRWLGDIVDGHGFVEALRAKGLRLDGRRALVVGSGGVGSAIAFAIADAKAREVAVSDIAGDKAQHLAQRIAAATGVKSFVAPPAAEGFNLVVNASPMGMRDGDPLPIDCAGLDPAAIAGDVVVHPEITPFLAIARERGCAIQPGTHMMNHQVTVTAEFFGLPPGDWSPATAALG